MGKTKTLGQLEWEARMQYYRENDWHPSFQDGWADLNTDQREAMETGASAVRKAVLTEAIEAIKYEAQFFDANGKTAAKRLATVMQRLIGETSIGVMPPAEQAESQGSASLPSDQSTGRDTRLHNDCDVGACCACAADEEDGKNA